MDRDEMIARIAELEGIVYEALEAMGEAIGCADYDYSGNIEDGMKKADEFCNKYMGNF